MIPIDCNLTHSNNSQKKKSALSTIQGYNMDVKVKTSIAKHGVVHKRRKQVRERADPWKVV